MLGEKDIGGIKMPPGVGILKGLAIKRVPHQPLELVDEVEITVDEGIVGDCRGARLDRVGSEQKRQVSVLSEQSWSAACKVVGKEIPWQERRAGLLICGIMFNQTDLTRQLHIGSSVILEITKETAPCKRMDEVCPGLQEALIPYWRGGVCCRVIQGGEIRKNDVVRLAV